MAKDDIRALLGKYNITEHAAKKRKKRRPAGETFEQQLKREGVITKRERTALQKVMDRKKALEIYLSK